MRNITRTAKLYMGAILLLPVFAQYSIFGGSLDLDVIVMLALAFIFILTKPNLTIKNAGISISLIVYIVLVTTINLLGGQLFASLSTIIMRSGRYCVYLFIVLLLAMDDVDYKTIMRIYRVIAYLALGYVLLQTAAYYGAGIVLPNKIGAATNISESDVGRLAAFYSEPADMSYSIIPFIVCSLFGPQYMQKDTRFRDAICISAAVILTTSTQGSVCIILLWLGWFALSILRRELSAKSLLFFATAIIVVIFLYRVGILDYALNRIEDGQDSTAWAARSGGYTALQLLSPMQNIFGAGYGNYVVKNEYRMDTYGEFVNYSSLAEILFTLGYVGTALLAILLLITFIKGKLPQKILVITMIFLAIGGSPFTGKYFPLYFSLMMCNINADLPVKQALPVIKRTGALE